MLFFRKALPAHLIKPLLWLIAASFLAACSFSPLYSDRAASKTDYSISFADPASRLEQIVYTDLIAYFGQPDSPSLNQVKITVSSSAITPGHSVGLSAKIIVTQSSSEDIFFSGTRTASASYVNSGQALANQQAANEASERAAHQLAQTIRLTLIGVLSASSSK